MAHGWTLREAEWLALVCLHSGVFLRSQYLAFIRRTNPALANRFVRRCRKHAVEQPWNGSRLRLCRIAARRIYRVLGVEHIRHRRAAAPEVVLRRLLSLDYLLEHPHAAWLPTEDEKVNALTGAGIAKDVLPRRLYQGAVGAEYRYFPHKLPVALDTWRATFVFVQAEDETASAVRTWGSQHAALWLALDDVRTARGDVGRLAGILDQVIELERRVRRRGLREAERLHQLVALLDRREGPIRLGRVAAVGLHEVGSFRPRRGRILPQGQETPSVEGHARGR